MKPDWKDAPEWANWLAMDGNGLWCWYEVRPIIRVGSEMWDLESGRVLSVEMPDWTQTLEQRPEAKP